MSETSEAKIAKNKLEKAYGKICYKEDEEHLERSLLNTLSSLTVLNKELSERMGVKTQIELFETKRKLISDNGIDKMKSEELALHIGELTGILKDFITLYLPVQSKISIEKHRRSIERSKEHSKETKLKRGDSRLKKELEKKRGPISEQAELLKTVSLVCKIPQEELLRKTKKELQTMLKEKMAQ